MQEYWKDYGNPPHNPDVHWTIRQIDGVMHIIDPKRGEPQLIQLAGELVATNLPLDTHMRLLEWFVFKTGRPGRHGH